MLYHCFNGIVHCYLLGDDYTVGVDRNLKNGELPIVSWHSAAHSDLGLIILSNNPHGCWFRHRFSDHQETEEWLESLEAVLSTHGAVTSAARGSLREKIQGM